MAKRTRQSQSRSERESVTDVMRRAQGGDARAVPALREAMASRPDIVDRAGNMARHAADSLARQMAGSNLLLLEGVQQKMVQLRSELLGPCPSPLEALLVDRIVCCWLYAYWADLVYSQTMASARGPDCGDYMQRRQDRCHKRFLSAVKALATVRRLLRPVVAQVNIAQEQVNLAATPPIGAPLTYAVGATGKSMGNAAGGTRELAGGPCTAVQHDGMIVMEEGRS